MQEVTPLAIPVGKIVAAPLAEVWELLVDTRHWPDWGPSVLDVDYAEQRISAGGRGRVLTAARIWLPFHIDMVEEKCYWHWRVCGVPATGHRLRPLANKQTELVFEVPWLMAPYGAVCRQAAERIARLSENRPKPTPR